MADTPKTAATKAPPVVADDEANTVVAEAPVEKPAAKASAAKEPVVAIPERTLLEMEAGKKALANRS